MKGKEKQDWYEDIPDVEEESQPQDTDDKES